MYMNQPDASALLHVSGKASTFIGTTIQFTEETSHTYTSRGESRAGNLSRQGKQPNAGGSQFMIGYGGTAPQGTMLVRALYDYEADDMTSLSFRQGDIIQVITQLESGWWDGVIDGTRGWFPSNYCAVLSSSEDDLHDGNSSPHIGEMEGAEDLADGNGAYNGGDARSEGSARDHSPMPKGTNETENAPQESSFWIPQATPDGRLFYFNTVTGVSRLEMPLETAPSGDTGPRDRMNVQIPTQTRAPLEMIGRGVYKDEDGADLNDGSGSDTDGEIAPRNPRMRHHRQHALPDGVSPAVSIESMNGSRQIGDFYDSNLSLSQIQHPGTSNTSFTVNPISQPPSTIPRSLFDDGPAVPLTWNRLVENMRLAVESYRDAITNGDRSEYVRRAEDISDHLRLLLAAGSGTTDNHSGHPSIISTNKALYPHFRGMMSNFAKLVLSSHIAAADWPGPESFSKCLHEADGVLQGVYGYVEVARQQRGEDIPRLAPGFVIGSTTGGSWQNNGLGGRDPMSSPFIDQDEYEPAVEPTTPLTADLLDVLENYKRAFTEKLRRLEAKLAISDKIVNSARHEIIGDDVCISCSSVLECFRPWIQTVESIDLTPLGSAFQNPQLVEFANQKQLLYDLVSNLLITCQAVAGPLADEWSGVRGETLEGRLNNVKTAARQFETLTTHVGFSLQLLLETMPQEEQTQSPSGDSWREVSSDPGQRQHIDVNPMSPRARFGGAGGASSVSKHGADPMADGFRNGEKSSKVQKFFGEVPSSAISTVSTQDEGTPWFLRLDHEGEIAYDTKVKPPIIRGGTLMGLVEQLTRHDKLDWNFNNTFLLTYRSFTNAVELFEMLVSRFSILPPAGLEEKDMQIWIDQKQKPIRFRVVNILKSWMENFWMEGNDDASKEVLQRIFIFVKDVVSTNNTPGSIPLRTALEQRMKGQDASNKRMILTLSSNTQNPILPKNMKKLKFLDIDPTEFARQLTIVESKLYGKIKHTECLNKTWQKKAADGSPEPAANVKALILHSNQLTNWVAEMILTQPDTKKRAVVIKHFVAVADKCRGLNNFSTLTSIISALGTAPIHRLARTWVLVTGKPSSTLDSMRQLMGSTKNFAAYREALHQANPPCIPFFGVYLTDLTFIHDGIPSLLKRTNLINFPKRVKTAEVIRDIQQYQNVPYPLQPVPELQAYILTNMQAATDVAELYDKSLLVEPREGENEKITRWVVSGSTFSAGDRSTRARLTKAAVPSRPSSRASKADSTTINDSSSMGGAEDSAAADRLAP